MVRSNLLILLTCYMNASFAFNEVDITVDHRTGLATPGNISLRKGDSVEITVTNTFPTCFTYNAVATTVDKAEEGAIKPQNVTLTRLTHQGAPGYSVTISKKEDASGRCDSIELENVSVTVPAYTFAWRVGFSGAFVLSGLTDPVFFLEAGENPEGGDGFFVRRNTSAEDSTSRSLAFMAHLYHDNLFLMKNGLQWAPLSFGIGSDNNTTYLLGTSLKFGDSLVLTAGGIFGDTERLPGSISQGDFTSNANAIDQLGNSSDEALFLSLSYQFGSTDFQSRFSNLFSQSEKPTPSN